MSTNGIITPAASHTRGGLVTPDSSFHIQGGRDDDGTTRDSYTAAAQTQRSHVIMPGENTNGKLRSRPASTSAVSSYASCMVLAATFCKAGMPGMHPASIASSFRFQHMGEHTDDGKVRT